MANEKLVPEQDITINIPFTYTIGEEGPVSGKVLETIEDCKNEVRAEIDAGSLNGVNVTLTIEKEIV